MSSLQSLLRDQRCRSLSIRHEGVGKRGLGAEGRGGERGGGGGGGGGGVGWCQGTRSLSGENAVIRSQW